MKKQTNSVQHLIVRIWGKMQVFASRTQTAVSSIEAAPDIELLKSSFTARANVEKSLSGRAPHKILIIGFIAMAKGLNYCGVGQPKGRSLYSPRAATVLFDCGNQSDLAEDVEKAVQEYVVDHIVQPNPETNRKFWITNRKGGSQSVGPFAGCDCSLP